MPLQVILDKLHSGDISQPFRPDVNAEARLALLKVARKELKQAKNEVRAESDVIGKKWDGRNSIEAEKERLELIPYIMLDSLIDQLDIALEKINAAVVAKSEMPQFPSFGSVIYGDLASGEWHIGSKRELVEWDFNRKRSDLEKQQRSESSALADQQRIEEYKHNKSFTDKQEQIRSSVERAKKGVSETEVSLSNARAERGRRFRGTVVALIMSVIALAATVVTYLLFEQVVEVAEAPRNIIVLIVGFVGVVCTYIFVRSLIAYLRLTRKLPVFARQLAEYRNQLQTVFPKAKEAHSKLTQEQAVSLKALKERQSKTVNQLQVTHLQQQSNLESLYQDSVAKVMAESSVV